MPFCFVIGGYAYIGSGYNVSNQPTVDNYKYDAGSNTWTTMNIPPFTPRMGMFSFTIGNTGYVGSGSSNGGNIVFTDFWSYDPTTDTWTQRAPFPGPGRIEAATFVINGKAYVVGGGSSAGLSRDIWEYDPSTSFGGTWIQKAVPPTGFSAGYVEGFTDGRYVYCGIGGANSSSDNRFWRYDPVSNAWLEMAALPLPLRTWTTGGTGLGAGDGFVGLGGFNSATATDFWSYNISANSWSQLPASYTFPVTLANGRTFRIGNDVYVGTGSRTVNENRIWKMTGTTGTDCIDFENDSIPNEWYSFAVHDVSIVKEAGHGNVLQLTDGSGASVAINDVDFAGNWLDLGQDGCLCFDYKVDWNESAGSNAGSTPKLAIYTGAPVTSVADLAGRLRASFVGHTSNPLIKDNTWERYCMPIGPCTNGQLPSNALGSWSVIDASGVLTGQAACDAWNALVIDVTGLVLPTDYNSEPSELVTFDNFCWTCTERPCATVIDEDISCRIDKNGKFVYDYCVTIKNTSEFPAYHSTGWVSGQGSVTVTPNPNSLSLYLNPIPPGGTITQCYVISGTGALGGAVINLADTIVLYNFNGGSADELYVKCVVTDSIRLPNCPVPASCCPADFTHLFKDVKFSLSHNGTGSVSGMFTAGSLSMQEVKVTLVGAYVRGIPAAGQITSGMIGGSAGLPDPTHDISFGQWTPCRDLTAPSNFTIGLQLPPYSCPPPPPGQAMSFACPERDSVRLRFQFVDCACRSCDTVIGLAVVRQRRIIIKFLDLLRPIIARNGASKEKEREMLAQNDKVGTIRGTLLANDSGRLDIRFPEPLDSTVDMTYVALSVEPVDPHVYITGAANGRKDFFYAAAGKAHGVFQARPGDSMSVAISYNDFGDPASIDHLITISYRIDGEIFEEEFPVTFYRDGLAGGDVLVENDTIPIEGARTIGLHLQNLNNAERPIDRLALSVSEGVEILAVGPTAESKNALLDLGRIGNRTFVGENVGSYGIQLQPGDVLTPIYITLRGGANSTLQFATIDANGNVITQSDLKLTSGIIGADDEPDASGILINNYPNPTSGTSTIELFMPKNSQAVELTIVDATGRIVQHLLENEQLHSGSHLIVFDTSRLPNGTYFCVVRTEFGTESRSLSVVR